jgi:hypothetical protein
MNSKQQRGRIGGLDWFAVDEQQVIRSTPAGTDLNDLEMRPVPVLDTGKMAFCWKVPVDAAHALQAQVRPHAETLGRWPVLVPEAFDPGQFDRFFYDGGKGDQSPDAVLGRAEAMTAADVRHVYPTTWPIPWDEETWDRNARIDLDEAAARVGRVPPFTLEDSHEMRPDYHRFERALFDWEEQQRPTLVAENGEHLDWAPWFDGSCGLMLMPTAKPWEVPAYTSFFGADRPLGHEALVRIMRSWWERFGAELIASWGTELQFRVDRPPTDTQVAYDLAIEQVAVAESTTAGPCVSMPKHARALLGRPDWYLHEKP